FVIGVGCWYINPANWTAIPVEARGTTDTAELLRRRPDIAQLIPESERHPLPDGETLLERYPGIAELVSREELIQIRKIKSPVSKWGVLGLLGLNHRLEPLDDQVRSPFMPFG